MEKTGESTLLGMKKTVAACVLSSTLIGSTVVHGDEFKDALKSESSKRIEKSLEAKKLVAVGDASYEAEEYGDAVDSYRQALAILPNAPQTDVFLSAVRDRYARSVVEYSKILNREGKLEEAQDLLSNLLQKKEHSDDPLLAEAEAQAYDPIRHNPALTGEHGQNVDEVKRLLYIAEGAYHSGQFDKALETYDTILRVDPFNSAARRGRSKVHTERASYGRAASDTTRAKLLTDVERAWEIEPIPDAYLGLEIEGQSLGFIDNVDSYENKLQDIIIPRFDVEDISLENALNVFKQLVREYDIDPDPEKKGLNIILNLGDDFNLAGKAIRERTLTLNVGAMPAAELLNLICLQIGAEWSANQYVVTVVPNGQSVDKLYLRQFSVPPSFMRAPLKAKTSNNIVFDELGSGRASREDITPQSYLEGLGVNFPEGASVTYMKSIGMISVVNSPGNMRIIDEAIEKLKFAQNVQVSIQVKVIDVLETNMEELGYDWIMGANSLSDSYYLGGGSAGNGTAISPVQVGTSSTSVGGDGITSGLRSGEGAFPTNSIDSLIANSANSNSQSALTNERAPGILVGTAFANNTSAQATMRGLSQKKGASNVWQSGVTTTSGQRARIEQVRLFIYPSEYDPPELPDSVTSGSNVPVIPATPTAFETRPVGRYIDIEPVIANDRKTIAIQVEPTFTEFIGYVNYGSAIMGIDNSNNSQITLSENSILQPVFEKTSANASITVIDGGTIAIGGLQTVQVSQVNDRVPVLSSIPFIGDYFKSNGTESIKRAVVIFVTAELVDPMGKPWRQK